MIDQVQHSSPSPGGVVQKETEKKKPTSPVKPMPQSSEYRARMIKQQEPASSFASSVSYPEKNQDTRKGDKKEITKVDTDKPQNVTEGVRPGFSFDSPHHYTPIEGTPYCFSRNDSLSSLDFEDEDLDLSKEKSDLRKEKGHNRAQTKAARSQPVRNRDANNAQALLAAPSKPLQKHGSFTQTSKENAGSVPDEKQNFSIEDTPVCFSRNSSISSLSDIDQENNNKDIPPTENMTLIEAPKPQATGYAPKAFHVEDTPVCFSRNSSLSSLSIDSEDDLLQECISSAMPKRKKRSLKNKDAHGLEDNESMGGILAEEPDLIQDLTDTQSPISEQALSPDSESFDWKAIQEGANSIVSSLHQAAANFSRRGSSDSDSILSLKSGISIGSPIHLTEDQERKMSSHKGPRILKPGEKSTVESKKKEDEAKILKGGKKVYRSPFTGKPRTNLDSISSQQRQAQVSMISRGRAVTHVPGIRCSSPSTSPVPKKTPPRGAASKNAQGQNSHNMKTVVKSDPSPTNKQSHSQRSTKTSARSDSRDSTRPAQPSTRAMQSPSHTSLSPGRSGISPSNKLSNLPRTSSPSASSTKSSGSGRTAYTSTGKHSRQQNPTKQSGLPRNTSAVPRSESASKVLNLSGTAGNSKKAELSRMSSTKSSGSESDRSEKPALVRQSTFIKEAPSPTLKRKLEESASLESLSPSSGPMSPTQSQTPVSSPSLPDMSLSSPCQGNGWRKSPQSQNLSENADERSQRRQHEIARSHSESPSRLPVNRSGTWKRENSKLSTSLPRVGTWKRTGSSSSILSASSESSEMARSEDERQTLSPPERSVHGKNAHAPLKGTWRKTKGNEMVYGPQDPSCDTESKSMHHPVTPAVSETEDVWVRIEDCPINNPRSGKSPTSNTPSVIDTAVDEVPAADQEVKESPNIQPKVNENCLASACTHVSEKNLNLLRSVSLDNKVDIKPALSGQNATTETPEITVAERTPFSSSSSSKHSSPCGAVAARVTPFNYNPSPRKSSADSITARPSQIPTPVTSINKKKDSKGENAEPSGSYIVTSV